ncbi:hypothetical protein PPTG_23766 [Phytophthora nicotianae INRA-310]|uniref:Uncharacterized protein n=1 Tax=Phytophthora nicotianae (strain INRA-310) TaxID=761204 RepID=W2PUD6_PHYN3|nr:hypothetical protein PPTG_23766 [Phytophthora nicotianae INRA-310]ETN03650.1 hypothetical protein PPTG_23766 [Phytophthora nicotianae INRA-310]
MLAASLVHITNTFTYELEVSKIYWLAPHVASHSLRILKNNQQAEQETRGHISLPTMTTSTPASAPPSPSPRAEQTPSDSESQTRRQGVVGVTGGDEPWTATAARTTSYPPPLRMSKRTATRSTAGGAQQETGKVKKKPTGRAISVDSGSSGGK